MVGGAACSLTANHQIQSAKFFGGVLQHSCVCHLLPLLPKRDSLQEVEEAAMWRTTDQVGERHDRGRSRRPGCCRRPWMRRISAAEQLHADYAKTFYLVSACANFAVAWCERRERV